ncbi:MAG: flavodoxin [Deltaproteobacteria bacterium]|nr:flavodoxin [Deltaproteobacteria bacterium]
MAKAIVIYGSETGNTESVAEQIAAGLKDENLEVTLKNVTDADVEELSGYDLILLGSSTWGDEDKELQADMVDFYEELENLDLTNIPAAAFGCGDSDYTHFCGAVDLLEERLEQIGARLLDEGFRVDGEPDEEIFKDARAWAREIAKKSTT